jgi:hypothetical protein
MIRSINAAVAFAVGLAAALTPPRVAALDLSSDSTAYISDPSFLPRQGQFFSYTTFSREVFDEDWQPAGRGIVEHYNADTDTYAERLAFGITDRLTVAVAASYFDRDSHYTFKVRPSVTEDIGLFDDPNFSAVYRAIEQNPGPVAVDIAASFAPGIAYDVPGSGSLSLRVNRVDHAITVQGEIGTRYYGSYSTTDTLSNEPSRLGGEWTYFIGARGQFRPVPRWAINAGVVYTEDLSYSVTRTPPYANYTDGSDASVGPYIALAYDLVPRRCSLDIQYAHDFISDRNLSGGINGSWISQSRDIYSVHLRVLF